MSSSQTTPAISFDTYTPRVAIVTGGSQGIGYAIAHRLADDGIDLAISDLPSKTEQIDAVIGELRKKGRRAISVPGDVTSEADVVSIVEKTVRELGSVDIMVANAGIGCAKPFVEMPVETLDTVYAINVRGVFLSLKYAALQMIKQGRGGRLIAASSTGGKQGAALVSAYSASKFAIRGLTQSAASELRSYGITVNTYAPGTTRTALLLDTMPESILQELTAKGQIAEPEVVSSIVSYFAKPESYFITGQSINVDGGEAMLDDFPSDLELVSNF